MIASVSTAPTSPASGSGDDATIAGAPGALAMTPAPDGPAPAPNGLAPDPGADRAALVDRIADDIRAVAGQQRCAVARHLHRTGISMAHLQVLWLLGEHGPLAITRVADLLGIAVPNATGLLDRMEQRGLVARVRGPGDRRVVLVHATEAGLATVEQVDGWRSTLLERLFAQLETPELARFAQAFAVVRQSLSAEALAATDQSAQAAGGGDCPPL